MQARIWVSGCIRGGVAILQSAGLLVRDGRKLTAPWEKLQANVSLTAA